MFFGQPFVCLPMGHSLLGQAMKTEAQNENAITFIDMFNRYSNIGVTRINWEGLPDSVSERFINLSLYFYGKAAFFWDDNLGFMCLPCTDSGEYNAYYEPTRVRVFSFNYERVLEKDQFVYIRNNPTCTPTAFTVWNCVKRMSDIIRTLDTALIQMKRPYILLCEEKERLTYLNAMKQVKDNEWMILGDRNFSLAGKKPTMEKIDMRVEYKLEELWQSYREFENILYTALGIDSAANEKKERLLVDEVNADVMVTEMSLETTLKELNLACDKINEKWGLDLSVHMQRIKDYQSGGVMNGAVYDGTM